MSIGVCWKAKGWRVKKFVSLIVALHLLAKMPPAQLAASQIQHELTPSHPMIRSFLSHPSTIAVLPLKHKHGSKILDTLSRAGFGSAE
jgi:hypothetical protein